MLAERQRSGGPDTHGKNILAQLDDAPHGFIRNLYPYSAIMPDYFLHYCYWSKNGPIARLLVDIAIVSAFPALSALVFENYGEAKSIPNWHVHAVVDTRSLLHTDYSRQPKIARIP